MAETKIFDLKRAVLKALADMGIKHDPRFQSWVKWVDGVNAHGDNGFAFQGDFVKEGTVEVELGRPRVLLACTVTGSHKYQVRNFQVVVLQADGSLEVRDIGATDKTKGWALRIRDEVKALVDELAGQIQPITAADVKAYLQVSTVMASKLLKILDRDPERGTVEVAQSTPDGIRAWMDEAQAIAFILEVCNA